MNTTHCRHAKQQIQDKFISYYRQNRDQKTGTVSLYLRSLAPVTCRLIKSEYHQSYRPKTLIYINMPALTLRYCEETAV
ncbi:hypothetical protein Mettu_1442 [Methylobacter tundripaludum SV96]|uniref:Uncharacterized protein n=1 Tax=Methylobacter tundripaludum (strain ATCC BAA-1195 / DSM 17260 / SV96) TaxID=697282 RepID=G3ITV6_METTV|nr:hypothetical protein Mettu_1442 [Methylobacter tundripaludum SV96]